MYFRRYKGNWEMRVRYITSIPFIFGMLVPVVILDVCLEVYHRVAFWCYKLPYVPRGNFVRIDRHKLSYLKWFEKIFCVYCGYVNGVFAYAVAIAGETERYWCPIKHAIKEGYVEPRHHKDFVDYGDQETLKERYFYPKK